MILRIEKDDFFSVLEKFPTLEEAYIKDFYEKYSKKKEGQERLEVRLKKNNYIPSDVIVWISYSSDVFIIKYKLSILASFEFIKMLKAKKIK